ncbi:hypothetical protein GCM10022226_37110 [Sphaerisporangium flaviroseum]|uniref:Uncharacterized protein n=1 Tax=Sphaerisporangium flaviroseum TaxID=509199 RepID=A0ABP7I9J8_9ACTN
MLAPLKDLAQVVERVRLPGTVAALARPADALTLHTARPLGATLTPRKLTPEGSLRVIRRTDG